MTILLWLLGLAVWAGAIAIAAYWVSCAFLSDDNYPLLPYPILRIATLLILAAVVILPAALITGTLNFTSIPDGCYRIGSYTGTGVGVGYSNSGPTVVPVVVSGRTYTPIACPA